MSHMPEADPYEVMMKRRYIELIEIRQGHADYRVSSAHGQGLIVRRPVGEGIDITYVHYDRVNGTMCNDPCFGVYSFELCYVLEGVMEVRSHPSGRLHTLREGELGVSRYPAGASSFDIEASDFRAITISFDPRSFSVDQHWKEQLIAHMDGLLYSDDYRIFSAPTGLASLFRQFVPGDEGSSASRVFHWRGVTFRLLGECQEWLEQVRLTADTVGIALGDEDRRLLAAACKLLESRAGDPPTLDELARLCRMNKSKLKRGFKQLHGLTITEFVLACKAESGKMLLGSTDKSITEVAMELGYRNPSKFSSMFRKQVGLSPREWRSLTGTARR